MKDFYFETPVQVMFHDVDNPGSWRAGIAYKNEIICGCCGGVFEISDIIEFSDGVVKCPIYFYDCWDDLTDEIMGGDLPEALDRNEDGEIYEVSDENYEQHSFLLEEEEEAAVFANTWVDGVAMPSID